MSKNKITMGMLKKMVEDVLHNRPFDTSNELEAEPPHDDPTAEPPEEEMELLEKKVYSYKGKTKNVDHPQLAAFHLSKCTPEEKKAVFKQHSVQTYDEFLAAVERLHRAMKPK